MHVVKETILTVKKEVSCPSPFIVWFNISLHTRTKLKKPLKNILNCCKLQIVFKNKTALGNNFHFKDHIPKDLIFDVV